MREIKFRAWDKKQKRWLDISYLFLDCLGKAIGFTENHATRTLELMDLVQFTGLKDKKGKEIYEGDILRVDDDKRHLRCLPKPKIGEHIGTFYVEMQVGPWGLETTWVHISGYECSTHIMGDADENGQMTNVEVVGNIYENPALLEAKP